MQSLAGYPVWCYACFSNSDQAHRLGETKLGIVDGIRDGRAACGPPRCNRSQGRTQMNSKSGWMMTGTALSLMMTAGVLVLGYALVRVHPINQIESLTLFMNCGEGFRAQSAATEPERIRHFSVCVDRIGPVESRSTSACAEGS